MQAYGVWGAAVNNQGSADYQERPGENAPRTKKEGRRPTRLPHSIGRLYRLRNILQTDKVIELIMPRSVTAVDEVGRREAVRIDTEQGN